MDKNLVYGLVGGVVGAILVLLLSNYSVNSRNYGMMNMMGMRSGASHMMRADEFSMGYMMEEMMHEDEGMSMEDMVSALKTLDGEEFDQAFIEMMIEHHQGAIDMANLVLQKSERQELRSLANNIISAQSNEIQMMNSWLDSWY